jgi:hypothetical protein
VIIWAEIENMQRVIDAQVRNGGALDAAIGIGGNFGEAHGIRRDKGFVRNAGNDAVGRRDAVARLLRQRGQQRPQGEDLRIRVRLLLAIAEWRLRRQRRCRRCVLSARYDEEAHAGRIGDVTQPQGIGEAERLPPFPHFERGRDMNQQRTCVSRDAAVEQPLRTAGQRIVLPAIRKGEVIGGIRSDRPGPPKPARAVRSGY